MSTVRKDTHTHKASIDEHIDLYKPPEPSKFCLEELRKSENQSLVEGFISELGQKMELLSFELKKLNFINDELLIENELWKEQYIKLQEAVKMKESGGNLKMHDIYQQNFITTINTLETEVEQKETKIANIMRNIKNFEKENGIMKKDIEIKANVSSSPTMKKDLMRKLEDLEKMNFHLNNELDQVLYEKRKNLVNNTLKN